MQSALTVWADPLGLDWPHTNSLASSDATFESNGDPTQAPTTDVGAVRKPEELSADNEVLLGKRAFADGILPMAYAGLRFEGARRIHSFDANGDSVFGTPEQHGAHWPWACPRMGIASRTAWAHPLMGLRKHIANSKGFD